MADISDELLSLLLTLSNFADIKTYLFIVRGVLEALWAVLLVCGGELRCIDGSDWGCYG